MNLTEQGLADYFELTIPELRKILARMFYPTLIASAFFIGIMLYNILLAIARVK